MKVTCSLIKENVKIQVKKLDFIQAFALSVNFPSSITIFNNEFSLNVIFKFIFPKLIKGKKELK